MPLHFTTVGNAKIKASGDIETLLDYQTVLQGNHPTMANDCFNSLFASNSNNPSPRVLSDVSELTINSVSNYSCANMFRDCTSLTTTPTLPATTLAYHCYNSMFSNCTSLTSAPTLPATTLATSCYSGMFYNCTSLTSAPALPATTLADYCYYYMFYNCTSLTFAPTLPATTLANYCYNSMFLGCTSLTTAPILPATTLANHCYNSMFSRCTSLTSMPALPVTTLANYCYYMMFNGCTNIKLSTSSSSEYYKSYRIPKSGTGTAATNALYNMFTSTGGTFTGTPTINTTYYTSNTVIDGLVNTKWRLNDLITDTVPGSGDYEEYDLGVRWKVPLSEIDWYLADTLGITVEDWDDFIDYLLVLLNAAGATNISSTLSVSDYAGNWLYFSPIIHNNVSMEFSCDPDTAGGYVYGIYPWIQGAEVRSDRIPIFTGELSFDFNGDTYVIPNEYLFQFITIDLPTQIGTNLYWYDPDYFYNTTTGEAEWSHPSFKTWEIIESNNSNDDRYNSDLINWLQQNATRIYTIQFKIGNTTYQAEYGMTWQDWVNSEYNTDGYRIQYDSIQSPMNSTLFVFDDHFVSPNNQISASINYGVIPYGGGGTGD